MYKGALLEQVKHFTYLGESINESGIARKEEYGTVALVG